VLTMIRVSAPRISPLVRAAVMACAAVIVSLAGNALAQKKYTYEQDPIRLGNKALSENRIADARAKFEEAIENGYHTAYARNGLADIAVREGRFKEAEALYEEAISAYTLEEGSKKFKEANAGLGNLMIDQGRFSEAGKRIADALAVDQRYWPANFGQARLLLNQNKPDQARPFIDWGSKAKGNEEGEDLYHHAQAMYFLAKSDLQNAESEALRAFHMNPMDAKHGMLVARIYERKNVPALAVGACEEVMQLPGFTPTARFLDMMGSLYQKTERYNEARDTYQKAIETDSTYAPAYKNLAGLLKLAKQYPRAARVYLRYLELVPDDMEALVGLAEACNEAGLYKPALEAATKAMDIDSTRADVRLTYARSAMRGRDKAAQARAVGIYNALGAEAPLKAEDHVLLASYEADHKNIPGAEEHLAQALTLDPKSADAYYQKGLLGFKAGQPDSAQVNFERAIALDGTKPIYYLNLGVAQMQKSQFEPSKAAFRKAIAIDKKLVIGYVLLGQGLASTDSLPAAEAVYQQALAIEPKNGRALRGMGNIHLRNKNFTDAAVSYKSATDSEPGNADGWVGLAQAYMGMGNLAGAESALREAQAIDPNNATMKQSWEALRGARLGGGK